MSVTKLPSQGVKLRLEEQNNENCVFLLLFTRLLPFTRFQIQSKDFSALIKHYCHPWFSVWASGFILRKYCRWQEPVC